MFFIPGCYICTAYSITLTAVYPSSSLVRLASARYALTLYPQPKRFLCRFVIVSKLSPFCRLPARDVRLFLNPLTAAITTVGYGEITPRSFLGRLITLPLLVFGLLLIALPSFVLGREFSIVWNEMIGGPEQVSSPHVHLLSP